MRKLIAGMKTSVDGKIEGADGYADWVDAWSEDYGLTSQIDACLLGGQMYPGYELYWSAIQQNKPGKPLPMTGSPPTAAEVAWATGPAADARAYAICLGTKEGVDIRNFQNVYFVAQDVTVKADDGTARQSVGCGGAGSYVLSGGARTVKGAANANVEMQESFPNSPGSWTVAVTNRGDQKAGDAAVKLYAVCIKK